jgi:hypothetical protein
MSSPIIDSKPCNYPEYFPVLVYWSSTFTMYRPPASNLILDSHLIELGLNYGSTWFLSTPAQNTFEARLQFNSFECLVG